MNIQTLHLTIPTKNCVNGCKFCCSKLHTNPYQFPGHVAYTMNIYDRLRYAIKKGCDTMILTSANGEVFQNQSILEHILTRNQSLKDPIINIELQTTGVYLNDKNLLFLKEMGVKTISLSIANIFSDRKNFENCGVPDNLQFNVAKLCKEIKKFGFNLRLVLLMTNDYDDISPEDVFFTTKQLEADQVTFKKLYSEGDNKVAKWIKENKCSDETLENIKSYILRNGRKLELLPFGFRKYSVNEISTVIDENCMATGDVDIIRYYIIREDGKLYTKWDDKGSLVF